MAPAHAFIVSALAVFVFRPGVAAEDVGKLSFAWPVEGRVVDEEDGKRSAACLEGIDILVPMGTDVRASLEGTVIYAGKGLPAFGNLILIRHDGGWVTVYGHNGDLFVNRGDEVTTGQVIAKSGKTGFTARPQLHFEIRHGETAWNPAQYLPLLEAQEPEAP